jgi:hypothetical protein
MGVSNLHKSADGIRGPDAITGPGSFPNWSEFKTTAERLTEWSWYERFIAQNPDIQLRWEQHKTYEILNNDTRD